MGSSGLVLFQTPEDFLHLSDLLPGKTPVDRLNIGFKLFRTGDAADAGLPGRRGILVAWLQPVPRRFVKP